MESAEFPGTFPPNLVQIGSVIKEKDHADKQTVMGLTATKCPFNICVNLKRYGELIIEI